jgi:hypothetical protein
VEKPNDVHIVWLSSTHAISSARLVAQLAIGPLGSHTLVGFDAHDADRRQHGNTRSSLGMFHCGAERFGLQLFLATDFDCNRGLQRDRIHQDSTRFDSD